MREYLIRNKFNIIIILIFVIFILFYSVSSLLKNVEIKKEGKEYISKLVETKKFIKTKDFYFVFHYLGKQKKIENSNLPKGFEQNIGKFYKIKNLPKYPDLIIVEFDKEVKDTAEILKAGFKIEDITH